MGIIGTILFLVVVVVGGVFSFLKFKNLNDNNTHVIKQKFNSENWFYLILFIIFNIFFSSVVTTESVSQSLIFILYPLIVIYMPIILLIVLNVKKKKQNLFKVYLTCYLLIIIIPFILNAILLSLDFSWTLTIKMLLSIGAIIYIIFQMFQKNIDVNDNNVEIRQNNLNNIVETNITINNKSNPYKIIDLIFYNFIIVYLILSTDSSDWGGLIMGPIVFIMIFIGNPLLTWILFRKNTNKGKIICISFMLTFILTSIVGFLGNPDNMNDLIENIENNKEAKAIKSILNDTNNNIEIYSNNEFKLLINGNKKCIYLIYNQEQPEYGSIQKEYKLLTLDLVQKLIDENTFNEYLLFTKNIGNETAKITMNIKYKTIDNKKDNQAIFRINDKYYILEHEYVRSNGELIWIFNGVLKENNILQEKMFSIIENKDNLANKTEYNYDFHADETFDYLVLYNEHKDKYEYYKTYKCDFENKTNSERLNEFSRYIGYNGSETGEYNEYQYIMNNGKIKKIIIYEIFPDTVWIEIFPNNIEKSLFIKINDFPSEEKRFIKDFVSFQNGYYEIFDENIQILNIELINGGVKINDSLDNNKKYIWIIEQDDEIVLQKVAKSNELIFERDLTNKEVYDVPGKYEIYLETTNSDNSKYIKISNSVFWEK
ncbi:MAG: hypothetical protein IJO43_00815 [Bacilli bacterium]|nr:hypothetical protein [Bacilli bacterium]